MLRLTLVILERRFHEINKAEFTYTFLRNILKKKVEKNLF